MNQNLMQSQVKSTYNSTVALQCQHRSHRVFRSEALTEQQLEALYAAASWTPSSTGQQRATILRITDSHLRKELCTLCKQDYHETAAEFWVFLADLNRNAQIASEQGSTLEYAGSLDKFFQGFTDAVLMCQNVALAAESMELGTVMVGSIHNNTQKVVELLYLPKRTFPVLALTIGVPDGVPQQKPRLPLSAIVMENQYQEPEDFGALLDAYDQVMERYYDQRNTNQRSDSFRKQVLKYADLLSPGREAIWQAVQNQGFRDCHAEG